MSSGPWLLYVIFKMAAVFAAGVAARGWLDADFTGNVEAQRDLGFTLFAGAMAVIFRILQAYAT